MVAWLDGDEYIGGLKELVKFLRFCALLGPRPYKQRSKFHLTSPSPPADCDYDLLVIGGGSGGIACAREAAKLGARVLLADYVKPSWQGTVWGLGGTCVNVGCIPKKLMHYAGLLREGIMHSAKYFGLRRPGELEGADPVAWKSLVENIQMYIKGLNFKYWGDMLKNEVKYHNRLARFVDAHTAELFTDKAKEGGGLGVDGKGKETVRFKAAVIAVGGRPRKLGCKGEDLAISSDDIFSMQKPPGKTLVVGAGYVALECAGFLQSLGFPTTVMVRSLLLRGFDRDMSQRVGTYMEETHGVKFVYGAVPLELTRTEEGRIRVKWSTGNEGGEEQDDFDTVLAAVGRDGDVKDLGLENIGLALKSGKIPVRDEQTVVPHM